jgi:chaperonin cofactor prefoldin
MNAIRLLSSIAVVSTLAVTALPAHAVFKCTDEKGVTHYGDTMPPQCAKRDVVEYTKEGDVVRRIDAPLTTDQLRAREEAAQKRSEELKLIREQRQKDLALIGTYGAEREFDVARDNDLAELDGRKKTLAVRIDEVEKQLEKYDAQMEFYRPSKSGKGKVSEPPPQLISDIARAKADVVGLNRLVKKIDDEKAAISARTDVEKSRWKRLKSGMAPGTIVDANGNVILTPPVERRVAAPKAK